MSLDQGTTSSRAILFEKNGEMLAVAQQEFDNIYPHPGWVEQDAMDILNSQINVAKKAMESCKDIAAIGITNQRETTIVWEKSTGKPVYNAIVWQCRRTADFCKELEEKHPGIKDVIKEKTGLLIDPYFSGTKIAWILDNVEGARTKAENGELLFGTVDTWIMWNLSKGEIFATDYSNASRTMLYNINDLCWDDMMLEVLDIPHSMLPEVKSSSGIFGYTSEEVLGAKIPIAGVAGDQQSALFGQNCFYEGNVKNTYGTGGFLLMNTGEKAVASKNGLLTTIAWGIDGKVNYALEGSIFVSGAAIQWLRDEMELIKKASETEEIAKSVPDTNGVYVVPAFAGLGAPYWNADAKGAIIGLTGGANKAHIIRATLESMAYQTVAVTKAMEEDSGLELNELKVDGGASANDFLLQFQSDILDVDIKRPNCVETTALGACYLAGLGVGIFDNMEDIKKNWVLDKKFSPAMEDTVKNDKLKGWNDAVKRVM